MLKKFNISTGQLFLVVVISIITVSLTFIPLIYGYAKAGDYYFTGKTFITKQDQYTYLSWIQQAKEGDWLFAQLYTSEHNSNNLFHPVFLLTGKVAAVFNISSISAYHILRAVSALIFLIITFFLVSFFLKDSFSRILTFLLIATSSGFGYMLPANDISVWIYEFNTFTDMSSTVLDPIGLSLVFLVLMMYHQFLGRRNYKYLIIAGILTLFLGLIHPYDLVLLFSLILTFSLYKVYHKNYDYLVNALYLLIFGTLAIIYQLYVLSNNDALSIWAFFQSVVITSNLSVVLLQYGLLFVAALSAILYLFFNRTNEKYSLLIVWFFIGLLIMYSPFLENFQRKFGVGYHIVLCILSVIIVKEVFNFLLPDPKKYHKILATILIVGLLSLNNIYTIIILSAQYNDVTNRMYFLKQNEYQAMLWLSNYTQDREVVLADYWTSNLIPGIIGMPVYVGHYDQTININEKIMILNHTLQTSGELNDPLKSFVAQENVGYIFENEEVRSFGGVNERNRDYLKIVYENPDVKIYKIDRSKLND